MPLVDEHELRDRNRAHDSDRELQPRRQQLTGGGSRRRPDRERTEQSEGDCVPTGNAKRRHERQTRKAERRCKRVKLAGRDHQEPHSHERQHGGERSLRCCRRNDKGPEDAQADATRGEQADVIAVFPPAVPLRPRDV